MGGKLGTHAVSTDVTALSGLNFKLRAGDRLGLIGHNGSGKTTLLRALSGAYEPNEGRVEVFIHAVGGQQEGVTGGERQRLVVDLQLRLETHRTAQAALAVGHAHAVVLRELFERRGEHAVDPGVAHVEEVRGVRLEHERAQRAHVAPVLVERMGALPCLRMQPRVGGGEHAFDGLLHRPRVGRAVVVVEQAAHCELAGHLAHVAAADAVGERDRDALRHALRAGGRGGAVEVLVDGLVALVRVLPDGNLQRCGHGLPTGSRAPASFRGPEPCRDDNRVSGDQASERFAPVFTCVAYSVRPVNVRPPTRLPSTVGISFQMR